MLEEIVSGLVEISIEDNLGRLTLNRPEKRNAFSRQMVAEGIAAIDTLVSRGVTVATLESTGSVFSAGDDISEAERNRGGVNTVEQFVEHLRAAPIFWIAVVGGATLGAAVALVAACPIVICSEDAWFKLPERDFGVYPGFVVQQILSVVGPRRATELAVGAEPLSASRAVSIGLATETVPKDELREASRRWSEPLRQTPGFIEQARRDWASATSEEVLP